MALVNQIFVVLLFGAIFSDAYDLSSLNQKYKFIDDTGSQQDFYHMRLKRQSGGDNSDTNTVAQTTRQLTTPQPTTPQPTTRQPTTPVVTASDGSTINIDWARTDNHKYYNVSYLTSHNWYELDDKLSTVKHTSLQDNHQLAVKIRLKFTFLFYGHDVKYVTIATGGFLYMSDFLHSFLTSSQYIAPLMANFDTSLGNASEIIYLSTVDHFVVEWRNVTLQDQPEVGQFTFQVQLYRESGSIIMAYKNIPVDDISVIEQKNHPVKVGLSDAYYWDVGYYRTIYPYHAIQIKKSRVQSNTAFKISHLRSCNMLDSCGICLTYSQVDPQFKCYWCSKLNKCSDGFDRQRQDWISKGCPVNTTQVDCDLMFTTLPTTAEPLRQEAKTESSKISEAVGAGFATFICLLALIFIIVVVYGYRNPESELGQFIIRNRPAELSRRFKNWRQKGDSEQNMHSIS